MRAIESLQLEGAQTEQAPARASACLFLRSTSPGTLPAPNSVLINQRATTASACRASRSFSGPRSSFFLSGRETASTLGFALIILKFGNFPALSRLLVLGGLWYNNERKDEEVNYENPDRSDV